MNAFAAWPHHVRPGLGVDAVAHLPAIEASRPSRRLLRVFSRDPSASRFDEPHYTVSVPYETLRQGNKGAIFEIDDYDDSGGRADPVNLDDVQLLMEHGLTPSSTSRQFMQQMTYAVGMETYERFARALGRDPGFGPIAGTAAGRLRVRPCAFEGANAFYDRHSGAVEFGYVESKFADERSQPGGRVYTAHSREIIVHEISHALIDGLHPNFMRPTHPDVLALHEGVADLIAVFMRFMQPRLVARAIERCEGRVRDASLVQIGRQFGFNIRAGRTPLRTAIMMSDRKGEELDESRQYCDQSEPHALGAVLVTAVFEAFSTVFEQRTHALKRSLAPYQNSISHEGVELLASRACQLARRFLNIVIRAIDYCPPLHCTFGEYLRAIITADHDLVPEDAHGYREAFITAFRRFGITVPNVPDLGEDSLRWQMPRTGPIVVDGLRFDRLGLMVENGLCDWPRDGGARVRTAATALCDTICTPRYGREFGLIEPRGDPALTRIGDVGLPTLISLRPLRRVSPDDDVHFDLVGEIIQKRRVREGCFIGGATIVVSSTGQVRYAIAKCINDNDRLQEQRSWLATQSGEIQHAAWAEHSAVAAGLQRGLHREPVPVGEGEPPAYLH